MIQRMLADLHACYAACRDGDVATYIPELARADPDRFAIVIVTTEGHCYSVGDADTLFTIQSISKPFAYGLALQSLGLEAMAAKVDVEPSGDAFNAISLHASTGIPRNPMINAGAIATTAQIWQQGPERAEGVLLDAFSGLAGRRLHVDEALYRSERDSGFRNRAIAQLLRQFEVIESSPEACLDLYVRQCAIAVTCRDLATMAASLACQGVCPLDGTRVFSPAVTTQVLAVMGSCGMYDYAGQWLSDVGMPAKSGVAGGVLAVVPGSLGIAVFSPRLDRFGNSVRGVAICRELSQRLGLHLFERSPKALSPLRASFTGGDRQSRRLRSDAEQAALVPHHHRIRVVLAQGSLDFIAIERLLSALHMLQELPLLLVLDLSHVMEISAISADFLGAEIDRLQNSGVPCLLSRCDHLPQVEAVVAAAGHDLPRYASIDAALEAAEDLLLAEVLQPSAEGDGEPTLLEALRPASRLALLPLLEERDFPPGALVLRRGEPSEGLLIVRSGRLSLVLEEGDDVCRLATVTPGHGIGEVGFSDGAPHSASCRADCSSRCWLLSGENFRALQGSSPEVAHDLLIVLQRRLGEKLERASQQLLHLERS